MDFGNDCVRFMGVKYSAIRKFEEKIRWPIEPGKVADFDVLTEDPLEVPANHLKDIQVDQTIVHDSG
jgi:predicted amidohydrolase YtcJ